MIKCKIFLNLKISLAENLFAISKIIFSNRTIAILETVNITPKGYVITVSPWGTVGTKHNIEYLWRGKYVPSFLDFLHHWERRKNWLVLEVTIVSKEMMKDTSVLGWNLHVLTYTSVSLVKMNLWNQTSHEWLMHSQGL